MQNSDRRKLVLWRAKNSFFLKSLQRTAGNGTTKIDLLAGDFIDAIGVSAAFESGAEEGIDHFYGLRD